MICPKCQTESGTSLFCYVCDTYLPSESAGTKASIPSRLGAYLLDVLVLLTLVLAVGAAAVAAGVNAGRFYRAHGLEAFLLVILIGGLAYFLIFLWLLARGQTPGKWLMDIRAVDKRDGSQPGLGRMLLRETLGKCVSGFFLGLGWFWAIWDRDAQAWHDKIARTVVLFRRSQARKALATGLLCTGLILCLAFFWISFTHALNEQRQPATPERGFSGDFVDGVALNTLFGNYHWDDNSSTVTVPGQFDSSNQPGKVTVILDTSFSEGGIHKHLLVTETTVGGEDCHACPPTVGTYLFANREGEWMLDRADNEVDRWGSFGHVFGMADRDHPNGADGAALAVKLGPDIHGYSLTITDGGQGIEGTSELFVAPVEDHYRPVLSLGIAGDNGGDCGPSGIFHSSCYAFKSAVRFLNSTHAGFFDIEVDQSGTDMDSSMSQVVSADRKRLYIFSGQKYIEQVPSAE